MRRRRLLHFIHFACRAIVAVGFPLRSFRGMGRMQASGVADHVVLKTNPGMHIAHTGACEHRRSTCEHSSTQAHQTHHTSTTQGATAEHIHYHKHKGMRVHIAECCLRSGVRPPGPLSCCPASLRECCRDCDSVGQAGAHIRGHIAKSQAHEAVTHFVLPLLSALLPHKSGRRSCGAHSRRRAHGWVVLVCRRLQASCMNATLYNVRTRRKSSGAGHKDGAERRCRMAAVA